MNRIKKLILMRGMALAILTVCAVNAFAQDWSKIDSREIPQWFPDSKFGIFIHWGLYSVPSWSPKGTYSEWYQYWLDNDTIMGNGNFRGDEVSSYHAKTYGKEFPYEGFAEMFKALDFDAGQLADIIKASGARYAVLTTKHHEGFALWPSKEATRDYGRPWNSLDTGPHRDLVREYADSLRSRDLKVGCYISLREWNSPLYSEETIDEYVQTHFHPQVKDLVINYRPDILWADGPDKIDEKRWRVHELLSWLYEESPVKDSIVVNNRLASWTEKPHCDFLCREYSNHSMDPGKAWEECRGIGLSFGYNRNEDLEDYASPQGLVHTLLNVVSSGGNLILGIGPDGNGKIPTIMQERLMQMGKWLEVNGEAIYGTTSWKNREQWSMGDRNWRPQGKMMYVGGDLILKQTVDPDPGYARKELFFTKKGDDLYAILTAYTPGKFVIHDIESDPASVEILGIDGKIDWYRDGKDIVVDLPAIVYGQMPCDYAWALKLKEAAKQTP